MKVKVTKIPEAGLGLDIPFEDGINGYSFNLPGMQQGGNSTIPIEAEEGEMYQRPDGSLNKVPEGSGTHEEGGVVVHDAQRVLEDTADKRDDKASKLLKMHPDVVEFFTGVKPKTSVSHSKALEIATEEHNDRAEKIQNKIKQSLKTLDRDRRNKYATNSLDLNLKTLGEIPTSQETFDNLFQHQELMKSLAGLDAAKAKFGKYVAQTGIDQAERLHNTEGWTYLYTKGNRRYYKKQDGSIVSSDGPKMSNEDWIQFLRSETPEHKARRTAGSIKYGYTEPIVAQPLDVTSRTPEYNVTAPTVNIPGLDATPDGVPPPATPQRKFNLLDQPKNQFNEPLHWYDVAGPIRAYLEGRIPAKYNPAELHQIRLQLQNPLPALQEGQRSYNQALKSLPPTGAGMSNLSDVFAKKYGIDTQILGQYENINKGIKNQETMYNANIRDRQSLMDQQAREVFEQKYLGSLEAQRQQKLTALDELYTRIAENRKLNREGNLLMKLFPAFNQNAEYNGYRYQFRPPIGFPSNITNMINTQQAKSAKDIVDKYKKQYQLK